jgi:hypothetical protein
MRRLMLLGAALPWANCGYANDSITAAPGPQGTEIMLYFRQPFWAPGAKRVYGLRIDQTSLSGGMPGSTNVALIGRRELFNLQVGGYQGMRLEFAQRVTWDFGRRQFNSPGASEMALRFPSYATATAARALPLPLPLPLP